MAKRTITQADMVARIKKLRDLETNHSFLNTMIQDKNTPESVKKNLAETLSTVWESKHKVQTSIVNQLTDKLIGKGDVDALEKLFTDNRAKWPVVG